MQPDEYWGLSLDDFAEAIWEIESDAIGSHYLAFTGDRASALLKMTAAFSSLIDKHLYRARSYGSEWQEGDEDDD